MIGAWLFMLAEHHSWRDSFYWAWITSLSIGYGDISPETWPGKMIAMCLGAFVLYVMTPLVVGKFVMAALANQHEFTHTEQEEIKGALAGITEKLTLMQHDINMMEMK
jgi:voltage-gated potassium channel